MENGLPTLSLTPLQLNGSSPSQGNSLSGNGVNDLLAATPAEQALSDVGSLLTNSVQQTDQVRSTRLPESNDAPSLSVPAETRGPQISAEQQQSQIATALSELTGEDESQFASIQLEDALELQEQFRNREPAIRPEQGDDRGGSLSIEISDANEQQTIQLQQTLQSRLAEQIPSDPSTNFPQLIDVVI